MRNTVKLRLPFEGNWYVLWGGDTEELNRHRAGRIGGHPAFVQNYAYDFLIHDEQGKSYKNTGTHNEDYFAFGRDVVAPADGTIVEAVQGIRDNKPGKTNFYMAYGNYLLIKHRDAEYSIIAHLKQGSTLVKAGDRVKAGQKLAQCGSSGNSSEPHVHYQLQTSDIHGVFGKDGLEPTADGIKVYFAELLVERAGQVHHEKDYSPVRGDIVGFRSNQ